MAEHTYNTIKLPSEHADSSYRCKVVGNASATLWNGRKKLNITVREKSGSGFTLGLDAKTVKRVKCGKIYELRYDERRLLVQAEMFVDSVEGESRLRVATQKEFEPKERWAFRLPFTRGSKIALHESALNSTAAYGGFVLVLFCVMALPGLGDTLGTAPRINSAIQLMVRNISEVASTFLK